MFLRCGISPVANLTPEDKRWKRLEKLVGKVKLYKVQREGVLLYREKRQKLRDLRQQRQCRHMPTQERPRDPCDFQRLRETESILPDGIVGARDASTLQIMEFLQARYEKWKALKLMIRSADGGLDHFAEGYDAYGLKHHYLHQAQFFEWAPGAVSCCLIGDFNEWDKSRNYATKEYHGEQDYGNWLIRLEDKLRDGEEEDFSWQAYNYSVEYDRGDRNTGELDFEKIALRGKVDHNYVGHENESVEDSQRKFKENFYGAAETELDKMASLNYSKFPSGYDEWVKKMLQAQLPPVKRPSRREFLELGIDDSRWRREVFETKAPPPLEYHAMKGYKAWEKKYTPAIPHGSRFKVVLNTPEGSFERVPAWAKYVLPDADGKSMSAIFWDPPPQERHQWQHQRPKTPRSFRIYECHVGMSSEELGIATFRHVTDQVLPHVKRAGYNVIQLMGVQEHADYSSAGYKVTSLFAVSSRFGTPEDFKCLVDTAHGLGLLVCMDIVHSHAADDEANGLSKFDGENDCYFQKGGDGYHKAWGTRMFNFRQYEVQRFLLSNLKWWVKEYRIDGFYFHSVTSMLYKHNGFQKTEDPYCNRMNDKDAQLYLILANEMLHDFRPQVFTIAEDVSLYPGLCGSQHKGGFGFDYYVNTIPSDLWLRLVEQVPFEEWDLFEIVDAFKKIRTTKGRALSFVENHTQSISRGRSLFQALLEKNAQLPTPVCMLRSSAIIKMIKLVTLSLGGPAYLNFMGNEFCHPEHVEFPSAKNNMSFEHARRKWSLLNEKWHQKLGAFDEVLMNAEERNSIISRPPPTQMIVDDESKLMIFCRAELIFAFNFNTSKSFENYEITIEEETGRYEVLVDTDRVEYGGVGRLKDEDGSPLQTVDAFGRKVLLQLPQLSAQVYALAEIWEPSV